MSDYKVNPDYLPRWETPPAGGIVRMIETLKQQKEIARRNAWPVFEFGPNVPKSQAIVVNSSMFDDGRPRVYLHSDHEPRRAEFEAAFPEPS